jgi:AraC-like DNA-binding protein
LLHRGRKDKRSLFLAIYALVEVITNGVDSITLWGGPGVYENFPALQFMAKPFTLLWVPLFWFYVNSCFSNHFKWKQKYGLHLLPFVLFMGWFGILRLAKGAQAIADNMFIFGSLENNSLYAIDLIVRMQYIGYNVFMILRLRQAEQYAKMQKPVENTININWLRFIVYGYALASAGAIITFLLFHINFSIAGRVNIFSILYFFIFFFTIFYDNIAPKSLYNKKNNKPSAEITNELKRVVDRLDALLESDPIYLNPELSLKQVAEMMDEKERTISQTINWAKQRNFKDYINSYRIQHACKLLTTCPEKPIFEVMFESGFNTKGPFNTAFKKITGKTPSAYRLHIAKS